MSMLIRPSLPRTIWSQISLIAAVTTADAIEKTLPGITIRIKWPNDLLCCGNKIGGILVQSRFSTSSFAVVGVGVNLHVDPALLPGRLQFPAASLHEFTEDIIETGLMEQKIRSLFFCSYLDWLRNSCEFRTEWQKRSFCRNRRVKIKTGNEIKEGKVLGINDDGFLIIKSDHTYLIAEGEFMEVESHS